MTDTLQPAVRDAGDEQVPVISGVELGDLLILEELGAGPTARVFRARRDGDDVRLRVLRGTVRRRDAERALVQARLCGAIASSRKESRSAR